MGKREKLEFEFYCKDKLCSHVTVNFKDGNVFVENFTDDIILQALGKRELTIENVMNFFEERCVDKGRPDLEEILKYYGLDHYDAESMCRFTHGIMSHDNFWIKFDHENLSYQDVARIKGWE